MRKAFFILYFSLASITVAIFCNACEPNENIESIDKFTLIKADKIAFELDSVSSFVTDDVGLVPFDSQTFYFFNNHFDQVLLYDWESKKLKEKIQFTADPRNNLRGTIGFNFLNKSTILIFHDPLILTTFNAVNKTLIRQVRASVPLKDNRYELYYPEVGSSFKPIFKGDKVLFKVRPLQNRMVQNGKEAELTELPILMEVNYKTGEVSFVDVFYPKSIQGLEKRTDASRAFMHQMGDQILIGFTHDPIIYSLALDDYRLLAEGNPKTKYEVDFQKVRDAIFTSTPQEIRYEEINTYKYRSILHDPYRKVVYRQVAHQALNNEIGKLFKNYSEMAIPFSIMIMDENLNKIGEVDIPNSEYYFSNLWFVTKEGLYLSSNNLANPHMDEDYLSFDLFKLEPLQ
jgi:hypothetical protein